MASLTLSSNYGYFRWRATLGSAWNSSNYRNVAITTSNYGTGSVANTNFRNVYDSMSPSSSGTSTTTPYSTCYDDVGSYYFYCYAQQASAPYTWWYVGEGRVYIYADETDGIITASNVTETSVDLKITRSPSGPWSVYRDSTRIAYGANNSSYGPWTHPNLTPNTSYTFYLYDAQTNSGELLDYVTIKTKQQTYTYQTRLLTYDDEGDLISVGGGTASGASNTYSLSEPTKKATSSYKYEFAGWSYSLGGDVDTTRMNITVSSTDNHGSVTSGTTITYYKNLYAVFDAIPLMSEFTWTNNDAENIVAGASPSAVITASRWNNYLKAKIVTLCNHYGISNTTYTVTAGTAMTAHEYNSARNTLSRLATAVGGTQPPSEVDVGDEQSTSQFKGLKTALNSIIRIFNNR